MNENISQKLKILPACPGVYFHKNKNGEIIYVGKASILKNRVRQYFQNSRDKDIKTKALVAEIADIDWIMTESEIDALFLEAEMVKRYMPQYNILLRDDKSSTFIRIDMNNEWPHVDFTHNPVDDNAEYFGPYYNSYVIKKALLHLRRIFPYYTKTPNERTKTDLDTHIGLSPVGMSSSQYKKNLRNLIRYINGDGKKVINELETAMKQAAKDLDFELAARLRNKIYHIKELKQRVMFGDKEYLDISKDQALSDFVDLFNLSKIPTRIEGYDISHMSGTDVVASMVVFTNGVSDRSEYRKFKTRNDMNNDFYNMNETLTRRLSEKNLKSWGKPDFILIDGGKGQLDAAIKSRDLMGQSQIPFIGLAKKDEQIIVKDLPVSRIKVEQLSGFIEFSDNFTVINLPKNSHIIKLLQRIRDESHRFAVSYHTVLKRARQKHSILDDISGIGPKSKSMLLKKFGSVSGIKKASVNEVAAVVGEKRAKIVKDVLNI